MADKTTKSNGVAAAAAAWEPPAEVGCVVHANIHAAKRAVMAELEVIRKRKQGDLNYKALVLDDLTTALQPLLARHGVVPTPEDMEVQFAESYQTRNGGTWRFVRLKVKYVFYHADSDTRVTAVAIGEGADSGDKAANKAMSAAYKYALWESFCVPASGQDPDASAPPPARPPRRAEHRPISAPAAPAPATATVATDGAPATTLQRRQAAVRRAGTIETLNKYRGTYTTDGVNTADEIAQLDKLYQQRLKELEAEAAKGIEESKKQLADAVRNG